MYVSKSEKLLFIIQNGSIGNYKCHAIKYHCPKKLVLKSFLDTILQSRSVCDGGGDAASLLPENVQFDPNLMSWVKLLLLLLFLSSIRLDYLFKVIYLKYYKKSIEFGYIILLIRVSSSYFHRQNKYKNRVSYIVGSAK